MSGWIGAWGLSVTVTNFTVTGLLTSNNDVVINGVKAGIGSGAIASNTIFGKNNFVSNVSGVENTSIGLDALKLNTIGNNNVALGKGALFSNTSGSNNTANGSGSLVLLSTGSNNTATGKDALTYTISSNNSAFGKGALFSNTNGANNTAIGTDALVANTTGSNNVGIGYNVTSSSTTVSNEVNIYNGLVTARFQGSASAWSFVSDARDKNIISDLDIGLKFINDLKPTIFEWNFRHTDLNKGKKSIGFIAQDVLASLEKNKITYSEIVDTNNQDQFLLANAALIPFLVKSIQELTTEIEQIKNILIKK
jgi:hypothetical protein